MELRPYQNDAVAAIEAQWGKGFRSTLLCLPTGCGKTIVFAEITRREVLRGGRVLILAHRGELLEQAIDKLRRATGIEAGLEKAEARALPDEDGFPPTVVVGSVQSMCRERRLERFRRDEFSLVIIDECHHSLTNTYRRILDFFADARLLGVTATPDRGDGRGLDAVFETVAFDYPIVQAVRDGYLAPVRAQTIPLAMDLREVASCGGDYQAAALGTALEPYLGAIASEVARRCRTRKTVVFTPLIATSLKLLPHFKAAGLDVREVNGESEDRAETVAWFNGAPPGSVLLNSMLLTEGWDCPSVDCVIVLRATKVRALYVQMIGRGTRLSPETGKENLLILDFLWMTQRHELCRPASLIGAADAEVEESADRIVEKATAAPVDLLDGELLETAESETAKQRHDALARKLEENRRKKGGLVDPLSIAVDASVPVADVPDPGGDPTMEQVNELERHGVGCPATAREAEAALATLRDRDARGLSSARQIRCLEKRGFRNVGAWTFVQAKRIIDRLAANGWRIPAGLSPQSYRP